jgi:hypothetical protein
MTKISNGTETTYYAYNELNQLTSSTVGSQTTHYLYDTNGNMTYDDRGITVYPKQFTWNQKNQLTQFTYTGSPQVFKYQYDVEGRKVFYNQNFSGGKQYRYLYEGNRVLQENEPHPMSGWNLGGRPVAVYTLAPGEVGNIISVRRSTTDYFYHYDGMGNVLFLTDTAGNKAAEYLLDSYGNIAYSQGASVNSYLWRTLPYDSSIESYQQTGSIYSSKNNKLLNAGYHQQQSEEYIDESKVDFSCGYCDYQDEDEFKNAKEWYKKLLILSVGNYSEDAWKKFSKIPGKPIARTDCNCSDKTVTLSEAVTRWYKNGVWDSKGSCCNYVAKIHEEVHQQQCIDLGWFSYNFYRFSPFIWTLEKPAYKKTVDELKSILDIMKMIRGL